MHRHGRRRIPYPNRGGGGGDDDDDDDGNTHEKTSTPTRTVCPLKRSYTVHERSPGARVRYVDFCQDVDPEHARAVAAKGAAY